MSIQDAIRFTLGAEGKFTVDDGGPTMYGVTQAVYDDFRRGESLALQSVKLIDMDEVYVIMGNQYWVTAHCGDLPDKLAVAHFDTAYNAGVERAIKILQEALNVTVDGAYGPHTKEAASSAGDNVQDRYLDCRAAFYHALAQDNPEKYAKYLDGWLNRVDNLRNYLKGLS